MRYIHVKTPYKSQKAPQAPLTDFHTVLVYVLVNIIKTRQKGSKRHTDSIQPHTNQKTITKQPQPINTTSTPYRY